MRYDDVRLTIGTGSDPGTVQVTVELPADGGVGESFRSTQRLSGLRRWPGPLSWDDLVGLTDQARARTIGTNDLNRVTAALGHLLLPTRAVTWVSDRLAHGGAGVAVRLRLTLSEDLAALPWEFAGIGPSVMPALTDRRVSIVREVGVEPVVDVAVVHQSPLTVAMLCGHRHPLGGDQLAPPDSETMRKALEDTDLQVRVVGDVTLEQVAGEVVGAAVVVVNGHGAEGMVCLSTDQSHEEWVTATQLAEPLTSVGVRLAVVAACSSAVAGPVGRSVGAALASAGVPAVVAMSMPIMQNDAEAFVVELLSRLAAPGGTTIDEAVSAARHAIPRTADAGAAWVPVLFGSFEQGDVIPGPSTSPAGCAFTPVTPDSLDQFEDQLQLASWLTGPVWPEFCPRDALSDIERRLDDKRRGSLVVIVGPPKSGKTRLLIESLRRCLADRKVWWAALREPPGETVQGLITALARTGDASDTAVVLDDLQRFDPGRPGGVTGRQLEELMSLGAAVVVTLDSSTAATLTYSQDHRADGTKDVHLPVLLERNRVDLAAELSNGEIAALPSSLRQAAAAKGVETSLGRLAEVCAAVDQLTAKIKAAAEGTTPEDQLRTAMVLAAHDATSSYRRGATRSDLCRLAIWRYGQLAPHRSEPTKKQIEPAFEWLAEPIGGRDSPHAIVSLDGGRPFRPTSRTGKPIPPPPHVRPAPWWSPAWVPPRGETTFRLLDVLVDSVGSRPEMVQHPFDLREHADLLAPYAQFEQFRRAVRENKADDCRFWLDLLVGVTGPGARDFGPTDGTSPVLSLCDLAAHVLDYEALKELLDDVDENARGWKALSLGAAAERAHKLKRATKIYQQALDSDEIDDRFKADLSSRLADLQATRGELEQATRIWKKLAAMSESDMRHQDLRTFALLRLAGVCADEGDGKKAERFFDRALDILDDNHVGLALETAERLRRSEDQAYLIYAYSYIPDLPHPVDVLARGDEVSRHLWVLFAAGFDDGRWGYGVDDDIGRALLDTAQINGQVSDDGIPSDQLEALMRTLLELEGPVALWVAQHLRSWRPGSYDGVEPTVRWAAGLAKGGEDDRDWERLLDDLGIGLNPPDDEDGYDEDGYDGEPDKPDE